MKYFNKYNITLLTTFSILLIIISLILCNHSNAYYKTRIHIDTVNLKITPYEDVNAVSDVSAVNVQQENLNENSVN